MKICDDGHNEICHDDSECVVCKTIADLDDANTQIEDLKTDIANLKTAAEDFEFAIREFTIQNEDLKSEVGVLKSMLLKQ